MWLLADSHCGKQSFSSDPLEPPLYALLGGLVFLGWTFGVEVFRQNPYACLSRVLRTLDLYYKVNGCVREYRDLVGVLVLRFDADEGGLYRCRLLFDDDTSFLVGTWLRYGGDSAMDPERLKRKIMSVSVFVVGS